MYFFSLVLLGFRLVEKHGRHHYQWRSSVTKRGGAQIFKVKSKKTKKTKTKKTPKLTEKKNKNQKKKATQVFNKVICIGTSR